MRAACRKFLDQLQAIDGIDAPFPMRRPMRYGDWTFGSALGNCGECLVSISWRSPRAIGPGRGTDLAIILPIEDTTA